MELISACAKQNRSSKSKYRKVWRALVSCTEGVLASGRGVILEKLGTVTYLSRSLREGTWTGHKGCTFVMNPKFARTFGVLQRTPPQRSLLAPAVPVSSARVSHTAGVDHDYTRIALAAIMDAIGRRISSGSKLCLPFGRVGSLIVKERTLSFVFAEGFRRPRENPAAIEDKYDGDVRRIMATLEAKSKSARVVTPLSSGRATTARPETSSPSSTSDAAGGARSGRTSDKEANISARSSRSGIDSNPMLLSVRSLTAGGGASRPGLVEMAARAGTGTRSRRQCAREFRDPMPEEQVAPHPPPMIAGAAAMVAGGPMHHGKRVAAAAGGAGGAASDDLTEVGAHAGTIGQESDDVSPRTAKKVLPHFLAIGNPGSQALIAKEGAGIVQKQARDRFAKVKAANLLLDDKELEETKKRQHAKWKEYEERHAEERKRLRDYLVAVKGQAEAQKAAKEAKKAGEFMKANPDPGRAYPCRVEYDIDKEQAWRKAWCSDLEEQIELKQRLEGRIRKAEVARDRLWSAQLGAAIKADRRREMKVKRLDREKISKDWATQVSSFAHPEGGGRRAPAIILDKIVS
ncbi:unnamed protein product [Scytosiphon promiscuus]